VTRRRLYVALGILVLAAALGIAALAVRYGGDREAALQPIDIGGPFTMTNQYGATVTEQDLLGHPSLLFFGYTFCPDVCPSTMAEIASWLDALGEEGKDIAVYFVTVDPARDTAEVLGQYAGYFSPRIVALRGNANQTAEIAASYKAYYSRIEMDDGTGDYLMDHTAAVYLMDGKGRFFDAITYTATPEEAVAKLRRLIAAS
jgi:protein SCO1/2